ncbi:MAG: glycosyltransferase family 1 protein [Planctomycetota bacterium]
MRVAIVAEVYLPKVDGVVMRTMNLIDCLLKRGDEVLVVCPEVPRRGESPVPLVEFPSFPFPDYPEYRIGLPDARLPKALQDFGPDVVHYLNPFAFGFRCHDVVRKAKLDLPSVFSFHTLYGEFVKQYPFLSPLSPVLWWLTKQYHNRADANLTVSTVMRDDLTDRGFERVHLWPPAVDSELFRPDRATAAMREHLSGGRPDGPLLLTVSRLAPEKNVEFLAEVLRQTPEARLAVVGDGPQRAELERRFEGTNANFVGYKRGEELAEAYASADAFVYASETETLGNVILEAMASGLSVVAPRAGGIPSMVEEGETGLLFNPGDTADAVAKLAAVLQDDDFRTEMGQKAFEAASGQSWENSADRVREYYQKAAEAHRNGDGALQLRGGLAQATIDSLVLAYRAMSWAQQGKEPAVQPSESRPN